MHEFKRQIKFQYINLLKKIHIHTRLNYGYICYKYKSTKTNFHAIRIEIGLVYVQNTRILDDRIHTAMQPTLEDIAYVFIRCIS